MSGYGVKIRVQNLKTSSELEVTDGRKDGEESKTMRFRPRHFPYSSVLVEGHSGYISLQAFHWLAKNNVPVFLTQFDGNIVSSLLPPTPLKADLRSAQFMAAANPKLKYEIAKALVTAKLNHGLRFLEWLGEYAEIAMETGHVDTQATVLEKAKTLREVRREQGRGMNLD